MNAWLKHPVIYEINTWVWLGELSMKACNFVTLANVPPETWDSLSELNIDAVWLMGVWKRSPAGIAISNQHPGNLFDFHRALPDFKPEDNVGSPYCVADYTVDAQLGGTEGLAIARRELARRGIRLILDYVPNHLAQDHPWIAAHPEYFIQGTEEDLLRDPVTFIRIGNNIFACGKDPFYPAWQDVIQINAFHPGLREAAIEVVSDIASRCDGIRCDMAMLLMNKIFIKTWGTLAGSAPATNYWTEQIRTVKAAYPDFLFIAEAYWDLEWELQQQGFDYCYDKRLYDRLERWDPAQIRAHLQADREFQSRLVRFIENHDEPRGASLFQTDKKLAATLAMATLPGARLFYEGQFEARQVRLPVFLRRRPEEMIDQESLAFHEKILEIIAAPAFHAGCWQLCECGGWADNDNFRNFLAWTWKLENDRYLAVINYSVSESQGKVRFCWEDLRGKTWKLLDMISAVSFERSGDEMLQPGLYVGLPPWGFHFFKIMEK